MELHEKGGAASLPAPVAGNCFETGMAWKVSPTINMLSTAAACVPGAGGGVLTVSDSTSCTNNANLVARENSLSQAAASLVRNAAEIDAAGGAKAHPAIDAGRVEAEIATLELLNQRDTMLCDDIRAACRLGTTTKPGAGGAGKQSKLSCWAAVQGIGVPKKAVVPPPSEALSDGEKNDDPPSLPRPASGSTVGSGSGAGDDQEDGNGDDHETSSSRKRVFSKYDEETTSILTEWFLAHKRWPYPASKEKNELAEKTNLTTLQISNWFTNKRKRHWTPVIKKRTRSPRDFFEFCVMNPKDHSLVEKKLPLQQEQQEQQQQSLQPPQQSQPQSQSPHQSRQQRGTAVVGANSFALPDTAQHGIDNGNGNSNGTQMHHGGGGGGGAGAPALPSLPHSGQSSRMPFDTRSTAAETPGGGAWLDQSRQQHEKQQQQQAGGQQQQQQQQQTGPQHPGALAPGLVYASTAARQAANMDPSIQSSQHIPLWITPPVGMERLGHSMAYPHGGMRTAQHGQGQGQDKGQGGPPHRSTPPQGATQAPNSRDGSRMNTAPPFSGIRGFDTNSGFHQAQQSHESLRRGDHFATATTAAAAAAAAQPASQQGISQTTLGQQQQQPQQQQPPMDQQYQQLVGQQQQQPRSSNPQSLPPIPQSAVAIQSPAPQVASAAGSSLFSSSSYRPPSPRNLPGPTAIPQRSDSGGGGGGGGDDGSGRQQYPQRFPEPSTSSSYSKGSTGPEHYPPAPPANANASTGGATSGGGGGGGGGGDGYYPPVAAFAASSSGGAGGGASNGSGFAVNGVPGGNGGGGGGTGVSQRLLDPSVQMPPMPSSDGRGAPQHFPQQQQQQKQYWDRSMAGRVWPPPSHTALTFDFTRASAAGGGSAASGSSMASNPSQHPAVGVRAGAATATTAGWR